MNILSIIALALAGLMMIEATRLVFMSAMSSILYVEMSYRDVRMTRPLLNTVFKFSIAMVIWALFATYMEALGLQIVFVVITFTLVNWNMVMLTEGLPLGKFAFRVVMLNSMIVLGLLVALV